MLLNLGEKYIGFYHIILLEKKIIINIKNANLPYLVLEYLFLLVYSKVLFKIFLFDKIKVITLEIIDFLSNCFLIVVDANVLGEESYKVLILYIPVVFCKYAIC